MAFKPLSCVFGKFYIPQRYIVIIMMHLMILNAYHLRVVLNIAMHEILEQKNKTEIVNACPMYNYTVVENIGGGKYKWSSNVEAFILYGFYIGYLISHVPGGWLADAIGARHVLSTSMLVSSLITFFYPVAIKYGGEWAAVVLRIILGIVQGPLYPGISTMIQCWVPANERGLLGTIAYGGSNLGTITGNILTGFIIHKTESWEMPFYIWSVVALIWYVFYMFMVFSTPATHPFITKEESELLEKAVQKRVKMKVPWKEIFKSKALYALIAGQLGHDYLILTMVTDLSKYFHNILKLEISTNGIYTAIPFMLIWITSITSAYLSDWLINRNLMSVLLSRRIWTAFSAVVSGAFLLLTVYIGCDRTLALILYSIALALHGPIYAGLKVNVNDITQYHGGSIMAIVNGIGALAGILGPLVIGLLTPTYALEEWQLVFWIMLGVQVGTTVIYWVLASADRQPWDYPEAAQ